MTYKQVIIIRKDLKMGLGKIVSHGSHASLGSFEKADLEIREKWKDEGAKKIVLKVKDVKELNELYKKVKKSKLPHFLVRDAGLTQLKPGTITCLGVGPEEEKKIDKITGKLKLL